MNGYWFDLSELQTGMVNGGAWWGYAPPLPRRQERRSAAEEDVMGTKLTTDERRAKADELYKAAKANHAKAYDEAGKIADPAKRQEAYRAADETWDMQREYQRKVRVGEA